MSLGNIHTKLACFDDLPILLELVVAFHEHLRIPIGNRDPIQSALAMLIDDPMCDFSLAISGTGIGLAYTQVRYFYSLWSLGLEAKLEDLYVIPAARRRGLGSRMLAFSTELARQRHCRLIALNTNERNITARNLYLQNGFCCQPPRWQGGKQLWFERSL